jgi:hypothetical protein
MNRFKDARMNALYEICRGLANNPKSDFWNNGKPRRSNGITSAFWSGYNGEPARHLRTSLAYAAWAAGRDHERAGR